MLRLKQLIGNSDNIEIRGFVSENDLISLYNKAKVFALPSINEGVGLVALEAAVHGCNIIITQLGGPKEYYKDNLAYIVNPYSIDEIGKSIVDAMNNNTQQPQLRNHIIKNYSIDSCVDLLINSYQKVLDR